MCVRVFGFSMKREKFSIWGREPDTKKGCFSFWKSLKSQWPIGYCLNEEEINHLKNMMSNYYKSSLFPDKVQNVWNEHKNQINKIKIVRGPVYGEKAIHFYCEVNSEKKVFDFSTARLICFGSEYQHESAKPKQAVDQAMVNAIANPKIKWKKEQGYRSGIDSMMHAHHIDGKEMKTIKSRFYKELKISEEQWISKIYPEHGNLNTCLLEYVNIIGWRFKLNNKNSICYEDIWFKFHENNREYELIDPNSHRKTTSNEIKFNTELRRKFNEME